MKAKNSTYQKKAGFKIPEGYLERFHVETPKALSKKFPSGFKTPDMYFESFTVSQPQNEPKVMPFYKREIVSTIASIAAVLTILFFALDKPEQLNLPSQDNISHTDIEEYWELHDFDFSTMNFFFSTKQNSESFTVELNQVNDALIFDYLTKNDEEITSLLSE